MSDLLLRDLADECAAKMADTISKVVVDHIKANLSLTVQAVLREKYAGEDLKIYVSKHSLSHRRMRNEAIRTRYNGRNVKALAAEFGLSARAIFKIIKPGG